MSGSRSSRFFPGFAGEDALPEGAVEVKGVVGGGEFDEGAMGVGGGVVTE